MLPIFHFFLCNVFLLLLCVHSVSCVCRPMLPVSLHCPFCVLCVSPNVASVPALFIFDCPFGALWHLFTYTHHLSFPTSCDIRQKLMYNSTHFPGPLVCQIWQVPLYLQQSIIDKTMEVKCNIKQCILFTANYNKSFLLSYLRGLSCLWSHDSWIYNNLCNQCLSPLKLWVWTSFMVRYILCNIMWSSLSVTYDRLVVFSGNAGFLHQ